LIQDTLPKEEREPMLEKRFKDSLTIGPPGLWVLPIQTAMEDDAILSGLRIHRIHLNLGVY